MKDIMEWKNCNVNIKQIFNDKINMQIKIV